MQRRDSVPHVSLVIREYYLVGRNRSATKDKGKQAQARGPLGFCDPCLVIVLDTLGSLSTFHITIVAQEIG